MYERMIKMKKYLFIILGLMLFSCSEHENLELSLDRVSIVVIDSCEYLACRSAHDFYIFTHKGNCKFCKERNKN